MLTLELRLREAAADDVTLYAHPRGGLLFATTDPAHIARCLRRSGFDAPEAVMEGARRWGRIGLAFDRGPEARPEPIRPAQ